MEKLREESKKRKNGIIKYIIGGIAAILTFVILFVPIRPMALNEISVNLNFNSSDYYFIQKGMRLNQIFEKDVYIMDDNNMKNVMKHDYLIYLESLPEGGTLYCDLSWAAHHPGWSVVYLYTDRFLYDYAYHVEEREDGRVLVLDRLNTRLFQKKSKEKYVTAIIVDSGFDRVEYR